TPTTRTAACLSSLTSTLRAAPVVARGATAVVAAFATVLSATFATRARRRTILSPRLALRLLSFLLGRLGLGWLRLRLFGGLNYFGLNCFFHAISFQLLRGEPRPF